MALFRTSGVEIKGILCAVPEHREDRTDHEKRFDKEAVDRVLASTEINAIHLGQYAGQTAGDLGFTAADTLLNKLDIDRSKIGILVFVSYATDYRKPGTSSVLQKRLGLSVDCMVTDVGQACAGFVYGQQIVESLMMTSDSKYGLLIVADTGNRMVSRTDHTSLMLGDAGAAILFGRNEMAEHETVLQADGFRFKTIIVPGGGFRDLLPDEESVECSDGVMRTKYELFMDGLGVLSFSTNDVVDSIRAYMTHTHTDIEDYDVFAFHQANMFIIKRMMKKLKLPAEKVPISLHEYGNTSCASIPMALCAGIDNYRNKSEIKVLASGFGIGLAWGVTSFSLNTANIYPIIETGDCYPEGVLNLHEM
ncbi:3-oxoacyl-ACP synthase III family protein [Butyrivibrio sp. XPD2006]|uniref:3-oxoacyl-ACP synthase III family protein n=1 Tax=Butyrivibrio sp. XPD2006 TaxID=1280668 RepID=UPI0003B4B0D3|nr:ketoacyl-ACP synthase III [Butyrivibrio sp. XPD2006]